MTNQAQKAKALARSSLYFFLQYVLNQLFPNENENSPQYLEAMCFQFERVLKGEIARLLATVAPRHLKSTIASVALPAFVLGNRPDREILVATYSQEFALHHSKQFRTILESAWYQELFPHVQIARGQNRADEIRTPQGGGRKAISVGGAGTGRGADLVIIDDINKASDIHSPAALQTAQTFYTETLVSRSNNKADQKINAIQQRLAEIDFAGFLLDKGTYEHFNLPVIAQKDETHQLYHDRCYTRAKGTPLDPDREPLDVLEDLRREMGEQAFSAQYLQEPVPDNSCLIRFDEIATCNDPPDRNDCAPVFQSWDPAFTDEPTSAYSVCTTWGFYQKKWYLLDVYRERHDFARLVGVVGRQKDLWKADWVVIEKDGSGHALVSQLRESGRKDIFSTGTGGTDKDQRLVDQSARLTSGDYVIPTNPPWFENLRREFRTVPSGRFRDQVDSITQAVKWIHSRLGRSYLSRDPVTKRRPRPKSRRRKTV